VEVKAEDVAQLSSLADKHFNMLSQGSERVLRV